MKKLMQAMVALAVAAPSMVYGQTRDSLSLNEVVERALKASPDIVQATSAVSNANSATRLANGAFLPTLSLSSGAGLASTERFNPTTNTTVSGSSDSYTAGLSAGVDVFTGGRRGAEIKRANAVADAAEATLTERTYSVTLAAKQAYFDVARAGDLARVAQARLQRADEGLVAAQRRLQVGSATRSDVLRAQLEKNNAKQALATAQSQEQTAAYALARLVGSEKPVFARSFEQPAPRALAITEEQLVASVSDNSPGVLTASANQVAARASANSAHAAYLPTVRLSGGYDWFNQNAQFTGGNLSWTTRVSLSYPLFNGFTREDNIARAENNARNAAATLTDARLKARADLERNLNALKLAAEQIALTKEAVEVAREDLRVQEERYKQGMTTILDRITSQVNLMDAENNSVIARYDYEIARAQLEALIGRAL